MDSIRSKLKARSALTALGFVILGATGGCADDGAGPSITDIPWTKGDPEDKLGGNVTTEHQEPTVLDERVVSYNDALRTASLKLTDRLPTLQQIERIANADDPKLEYEVALDELLESPAFQRRMVRFFKDVFRQGGSAALDTAPHFAARIVVEGRPLKELFTATENNCPGYDNDANAFVDGDCANNVPKHAGVLTNPGTMRQFYSNMAFRRVRWVQEVFACTKFPTEYSETPKPMGAGSYTSPWEFDSISNTPIDFHDTKSVICANCHTTINHLAPLFANFDKDGMWQNDSQVMTPLVPDPVKTELSHWLPAGELTGWRVDQPAADLPALGAALAADPNVTECIVARLWNYTMSKEDIVTDLSTVPLNVIGPYIGELANNGENLRETLRSMFKSDDFVKF
ncbi:MAG: DUF1588 domain-containing protein [Myxococcales bacterium]|nr:DUF1588 domain-containing protein [Myxococcales bacterium]